MGREYIPLSEFEFPSKCPYCGGNEFVLEVGKKVIVEETYRVEKENIKKLKEDEDDIEWEVAYGIRCAKCGEDLSDYCGF